MSELIVPKGTVVHIAGFPFSLLRDTKMIGHPDNMALAMQAAHPDRAKPDSVHFDAQSKEPSND